MAIFNALKNKQKLSLDCLTTKVGNHKIEL